MTSQTQPAWLEIADAIRPALNRIVFSGIETCQSSLKISGAHIRGAQLADAPVHAVATVSLDRISTELAAGGLQRISRSSDHEEWQISRGRRLVLSASATETADQPLAMARDYAVLLTRTTQVSPEITARSSAPVALVPLWWTTHVQRGVTVAESPFVEDMIELVVRYRPLLEESAGVPSELRDATAAAARAFLADDSCEWAIARALPDARMAPAVIKTALDRFRQLAAAA